MQLQTTTVLKDVTGKPIGEPELTVRAACTAALLGYHAEDDRVSGEDKYKRFKLACRINDNDAAELSAEDVVLLKRLIARAYTPLVLGPMYDLLEP